MVRALLAFFVLFGPVGCRPQVIGHVWSVNAYMFPQPLDQIRAELLSLGLSGPLQITGGSMCATSQHYEKQLEASQDKVRIYDCLVERKDSETGWVYFVSVGLPQESLEPNTKKEIDLLINKIKSLVDEFAKKYRVTMTYRESTVGFSLMPF